MIETNPAGFAVCLTGLQSSNLVLSSPGVLVNCVLIYRVLAWGGPHPAKHSTPLGLQLCLCHSSRVATSTQHAWPGQLCYSVCTIRALYCARRYLTGSEPCCAIVPVCCPPVSVLLLLHLLLQVTDIRMITDRHTKKSKGLAYVEFSKQEEVFAALTLTGQVRPG